MSLSNLKEFTEHMAKKITSFEKEIGHEIDKNFLGAFHTFYDTILSDAEEEKSDQEIEALEEISEFWSTVKI